MKVENFYNKNQYLIRNGKEIIFQSYNSEIAKIDEKGNLTLGIDWDYSKTTSKHLYLFLEDYFSCLKKEIQENIYNFWNSKTKKQFIQKMIDKKIVNYDKNMQ